MKTEKPYLLLIDDEPNVLTAYRIMLEESGYFVLTASCGEEALKILEEFTVAVCLVDLKLKEEDGLQVSCDLYRVDPLIKIIIITAYPTYETAVDALKMGIFDYMSKTEDPRILLQKIEIALEVRSSEILKNKNTAPVQKKNIILVCGHVEIQEEIENFCNENPSYKLTKSFLSCSYIKPFDADAKATLLLLCKSCFNPKALIEPEVLFDRLHSLFPNAGIAMIGGEFTEDEKYGYLQYGVRGFIEEISKDSMKKAFDLIVNNQFWVDRQLLDRVLIELLEKSARNRVQKCGSPYNLSRREVEMLEAMSLGMSNLEIGDKFNISENTVKIHIYHIFKKLNVKSRLQAVMKAHEDSII